MTKQFIGFDRKGDISDFGFNGPKLILGYI
jgi:hypothetical protein